MFILKMKTEKIHDQFNKMKGVYTEWLEFTCRSKETACWKKKRITRRKKFLSEKQEEKLKP